MQALTYLQRALLVHDLQKLDALEWESCFNKVLFPLLTKLLENISPADVGGMEETRMRASTLLSKVLLTTLPPPPCPIPAFPHREKPGLLLGLKDEM